MTILPELVERAGGAARFAWEDFFFAEDHSPHTQPAYGSVSTTASSMCCGFRKRVARAGKSLCG
jgi:hypothetical protein